MKRKLIILSFAVLLILLIFCQLVIETNVASSMPMSLSGAASAQPRITLRTALRS
jgi:hypothetical protein